MAVGRFPGPRTTRPLLVSSGGHDAAVSEEDVVVVVGVGTADIEPDRVRASIGVSTVAETVGAALAAAAVAQDRIIAVALAAGVGRSAIQTIGYHVGPEYDANGPANRHRADATLSIVVHDVAGAGELLGAMSEAAGDSFRVHGVMPESSQEVAGRREARASAVRVARQQAEELAAAASVRLGRLRSLVEGGAAADGPWRGGAGRS